MINVRLSFYFFLGPGSYVYREDSIKKFKKSTFPKLAPRQNVGKPRGIVCISNGDVVMDRSKDRLSYGNRLKLDMQKDPLKTNIAVSIAYYYWMKLTKRVRGYQTKPL